MSPGRLVGIGTGPGDPELLTLKAVRLLGAADVVAHVAAEGRPSLARATVAAHLGPGRRELALALPMAPGEPESRPARARASALLAAELEAGRVVALLCEGDPLFYGSFLHLARPLVGRFPVEVVPGVSAIGAAAAGALVPLASRDGTLQVLPALLGDAALAARLAEGGTSVILKLGRHLARLRALLGRLGLLERAVYVERATLPGQRILPLADLDADTAPYFSLLIVPAEPWP